MPRKTEDETPTVVTAPERTTIPRVGGARETGAAPPPDAEPEKKKPAPKKKK